MAEKNRTASTKKGLRSRPKTVLSINPITKKPIRKKMKANSRDGSKVEKRKKVIIGVNPLTKKPFKKTVFLPVSSKKTVAARSVDENEKLEKRRDEIFRGFYRWPPKSRIRIYDSNGDLLLDSFDKDLDLADATMISFQSTKRVVFLRIRTNSTNWTCWNDERLSLIEGRIKYDFQFDGYKVKIERVSRTMGPCSKSFKWKLSINYKP